MNFRFYFNSSKYVKNHMLNGFLYLWLRSSFAFSHFVNLSQIGFLFIIIKITLISLQPNLTIRK